MAHASAASADEPPQQPHSQQPFGNSSSDSQVVAALPDLVPLLVKKSGVWRALVFQYRKFTALSGRFMPMVFLFFLMAFVNTILDSLKDTLVITAVGGGAQVCGGRAPAGGGRARCPQVGGAGEGARRFSRISRVDSKFE